MLGARRLLLVAADETAVLLASEAVAPLHWALEVVGTAEHAVEWLQSQEAAAVLLDLHLPGTAGLDAVRLLAAAAPGTPLAALSDQGAAEVAIEAIPLGASLVVPKRLVLDREGHPILAALLVQLQLIHRQRNGTDVQTRFLAEILRAIRADGALLTSLVADVQALRGQSSGILDHVATLIPLLPEATSRRLVTAAAWFAIGCLGYGAALVQRLAESGP